MGMQSQRILNGINKLNFKHYEKKLLHNCQIT